MLSALKNRWSRRETATPWTAEEGFSLVELLVVLSIVLILSTIAVPQFLNYLDRAKRDGARVAIENIGASLDMYRLDVGRYPTQSEGLAALVKAPPNIASWNGPYLKRTAMLLDPWTREYRYKSPGDHGSYDLFSWAADNAEGGEGADRDVTSW